MKRRVFVPLLSALAMFVVSQAASQAAQAATIMHETFKGDAVITRNVNAPKPGAYLLILKNGTVGPHNIEQCDVEDSDEEKNECLSRNLSENVDQDFSRAKEAEIKINGRWVQGITNARSLLIVPVTLKGGTNKIDLKLQGRSSSKLTVSLEPAPQAALPPEAAFLLSRLINPVRTPFTFDAKESFSPNGNSLRYSWNFGDGAIESGKSRVSHSFSKPGTYSVQLTVTDQATRLSSSFSVDVTVLSIDKTKPPKNEKPKPVIQYALDTVNPLNVTFDGTSSTDDGTIVSYRWQITDENHEHRRGSTVERTGVQFDYTFPRAGSYTVRLTVKDNQGAEAATERAVSTSDMSGLVRDESLFGPKKYYSKKKVIESLLLESPRLAVLKIKNADGLEHPIESCSSTPWPEKLGCLFQNSVNRAYIALYRVSKAEIFINGQLVTDRIGKHTAYFETVVSLQTSNTIEIRTKGWPSAFIELELQSLEVNEAPIVYVTHSEPRRGIPQLIEFDASTSVDMNDHIMSYRFQVLNAAGAVAIDTDWQGAGYAALEFTERGTFTVVVSARDTFGAVGTKSVPITIESNQLPLLTASYVVLSNQAPYQVRVTATASDPDGDAIQYNFAYSTGQVSGFQDSPQGLTSFAAAGTYSVDVTARDANGGTATFTLPITVGGNLLPIANFDFVTDRGGYAPLTITVDASPSSDPDDATETLRYFWTFGDSSPRVEGKILSHTFINQGQYTVTLSVLDPKRGLSTKSRAAFAWRTTPPNPVLIANPRVGPASLTVDFDASQSTPGASAIASYLFDYADGTFESSLTPFKTHTFTQPGIYNVGLIVYDTDGNGNIGGQTIYVFDGKKPSAAIQVVSSDVITPARFELLGSGVSPNPLGTITDYKWTLPNGTVQTGASLVYTTSTNGNFAIKLEVKDSYGYWSDPAILDLSAATGTLPIAQITADKTRIALGQAVKLSGLNSYTSNGQANLVSYEWTLPNGTKIYGPEKTVTLSATGLKTISLIVTDSKGYVSSPATIQIQVDARQTPTAVITASTSGTVIPVTAIANGRQSTTPNPGATITGYEWKLQAPDATPPLDIQAFGPEIQGVLTWPVNYTLSLRVFDSAGAVSGWVSHTFGPLLNTPPIAVITPSSVIDTAPTTVTLSSIGSTDPDGHNIINAHWIFSDGGEYWGLIAPYYIASPGNYTATVRVLDEYGAWSDPVTIPITLNANLPPVALMTAAPDANNKFNFTFDASTSFDLDGTIARYDWFFSDGFVSLGAGSAISHAFPAAGTWRAGVNVFDNKGAMATVQVEVTVSANLPPVARIQIVSKDYNSKSVSLSAATSTDDNGIVSYLWEFEDGTTSNTVTAVKTFADVGSHKITLTVTDIEGQANTVSQFALIDYDGPPLAYATAAIEQGLSTKSVGNGETLTVDQIAQSVQFSAEDSLVGNQPDNQYYWTFGDGTNSSEQNPVHRFSKPGIYEVALKIKDINNVTSVASLNVSVPAELCAPDEQATCFNVVDQDPTQLDPSRVLVVSPTTPMIFADNSVSMFLSRVEDEYESDPIDVSSYASTQNGQLILNVPAVLGTLSAPLETYDLSISVVGLPDLTPIHGTVRSLSIAGGTITVAVDSTMTSISIRDSSTGIERKLQPNSTTATFSNLPQGSYAISANGPAGSAVGTAFVSSPTPITLSGSLHSSVTSAIANQLQEQIQIQNQIQSSGTSKTASTSFSKTLQVEPQMQAASSSDPVPLVISMSPFPISGTYPSGSSTIYTIGPINDVSDSYFQSYTGITTVTDPSKLPDSTGYALAPGESVNISCKGYSESWNRPLYQYLDADYQTAEGMYDEWEQLKEIAQDVGNHGGTLSRAAQTKYNECLAMPRSTGDPNDDLRFAACLETYSSLYNVYYDYYQGTVLPAFDAADRQGRLFSTFWNTDRIQKGRVWKATKVVGDVTYRLIAHLKSSQTNTFRSIEVGRFSTAALKGNWIPDQSHYTDLNYGIVGTNSARFSFTLPQDVPAGTKVVYELKHNGGRVQHADISATGLAGGIVPVYPRHHAYCSPVPSGPTIEITKLGSFQTAGLVPSSTVSSIPKSTTITDCVENGAATSGAVECSKVRTQLRENSRRLFSLAYFGESALFPLEVDSSTKYPDNRSPFPGYNPFTTQSNEYQRFVEDNHDLLISVGAKFKYISTVKEIELHLVRGASDVLYSVYPVNKGVAQIVSELQQNGIPAVVTGTLGIAKVHVSQKELSKKILDLNWDEPGATMDSPQVLMKIVVKGLSGAQEVSGAQQMPVLFTSDLKKVTSDNGAIQLENHLYANRISAFGIAPLRLFAQNVANALASPESPFAQLGPFKMNDGALPYGGAFPPHNAHQKGINLDIKYFGGSSLNEENYDKIWGTGGGTVQGIHVPAGKSLRYMDILKILEYSKNQKNPGEYTLMDTDESCLARFNTSELDDTKCLHRITVEKCLYQTAISDPEPGHSLAACTGTPPLAEADRLMKWVSANRAGIAEIRKFAKTVPIFTSRGTGWYNSLVSALQARPSWMPANAAWSGFPMSGDGLDLVQNLLEGGKLPNSIKIKIPIETQNGTVRVSFQENDIANIQYSPGNETHYDHIHIDGISQ